MTRYSAHVSNLATPQMEQARHDQVENNAGGFVFQLDCWKRLDRFLVLGTEGGTYYVDEKKHTKQAAKAVEECIKADGPRTVARIVEISDAGRAPKNDPAIFALAMCTGADNPATRSAALAALPKVCRIGTHLFHFAADVEHFRRWGRSLRTAVGKWYTEKSAQDLALQVIKYQQRDGWSHKDVLRLSHPAPKSPEHAAVMRYAAVGMSGMDSKREKHARDKVADTEKLPAIISAFEEIHSEGVTPGRAARLITEYKLPHECVPNEMKGEKIVWEALLPHMGLTALIRNLGKLSSIGMTKPMGDHTKFIVEKLTDKDALKKGRVHPMTILYAMKTYAQGHGLKGSLTWTAERAIVDALDDAFYASFDAIEPTGKPTMLALDVSGSMGSPMGNTSLTCREASAAMAMVTARTEKNWACVGFTSGGRGYGGMHGGDPSALTELKVSPRQRLDDVVKEISNLPFGGTDCSLPMLHASKHNLVVDVFHVYCVDEKTEILTADGWKHHDALAVGEEVYTLNHETAEAEWQKTSAVNVFPAARREMLLMEGRGHSSLTTMDHRWPVRWRGNGSRWGRRWKTSADLNMVDYIQCAGRDTGLPTEPKWDDAFVEIAAWLWTEGCWNESNAFSLCQSAHVHPENCERIRTALAEHFGPPHDGSMYPDRYSGKELWTESAVRPTGMIDWHVNQEGSGLFTEIMTIPEKVVSPRWLRTLTAQQLELFVEVSMLGDGHVAKNRLAQSSRGRAESFAFACTLLGKPVSFTEIDNKHNSQVEIGMLQRYQFAPLQNANNKDKRPFHMERVSHDGIVWCPTTPNGTWMARRNGSVYWTGNTDNETWAGHVHPFQALKQYRQKSGRSAKLIVVGMTASEFSIADQNDGGMLDVVGFDTATPNVMAEFARG